MRFADKQVIHADGKRAIIYLRVSSEEQVDNFSLSTQEDICRKEAKKREYEIIEVFREEGADLIKDGYGVRPGFSLEKGVDAVFSFPGS